MLCSCVISNYWTRLSTCWRVVNRFSDQRTWPEKACGLWIFVVDRADSWILKTQWIVDQINVNFVKDFGSCLHVLFGSWVLNEIWITVLSSSKLFLFSNEAHSRLLLELFCVIVIKHVAFFTMCAKLTIAFTFPSLLRFSITCGL